MVETQTNTQTDYTPLLSHSPWRINPTIAKQRKGQIKCPLWDLPDEEVVFDELLSRLNDEFVRQRRPLRRRRAILHARKDVQTVLKCGRGEGSGKRTEKRNREEEEDQQQQPAQGIHTRRSTIKHAN